MLGGGGIGETLDDFVHDFGVPEHLTFDGFQSKVGENTKFNKNIRRYRINNHSSALRQPNKNTSKGAIRETKRRFYRTMVKKHVPKLIWEYLEVWIWETGNPSVSSSWYVRGWTALKIITRETLDISEYLDFVFYDWVLYQTNAGLWELSLVRWMGLWTRLDSWCYNGS